MQSSSPLPFLLLFVFVHANQISRSKHIAWRVSEFFLFDLDLKQSFCRDLRDCQTYFPCAVFSSGFSYLYVIKRCSKGQVFDEKKQKCVKYSSEQTGCAKQVTAEKARTPRVKSTLRPSVLKKKNFEQTPEETTPSTTEADEPGQNPWQRVCYVTNWSRYRAGEAKFEIEYIDPFMCSHIVYAYATVDENKPEIIPIQKEDIGKEKNRAHVL